MVLVVAAVAVLSVLHLAIGSVSVCVGVALSAKAEVWLAHTVSPIWSGCFFISAGILGFASIKQKAPYTIMCLAAICIVSILTAVVSIQLLRLGLVNQTTAGDTFEKESKDILILLALGCEGLESLLCVITVAFSWSLSRQAKREMAHQRNGAFHIRILSDKEIMVVSMNGDAHKPLKEKFSSF